ncbi:MAG TPA: hypothetical protein VND99_03425 [Candidatus Acidoferrales bacterium]|nr:hypothetical protein [Candidatus Acidoferrales bacterium]
MEDNQQSPSPVIVFLKKIWPFVYRVINGILYFLLSLIRGFFKMAFQMIKGD